VASPRNVGVCDTVSRDIDGRGQTQISMNWYLAFVWLARVIYIFYIQKCKRSPERFCASRYLRAERLPTLVAANRRLKATH
jgi:hypothetical protein